MQKKLLIIFFIVFLIIYFVNTIENFSVKAFNSYYQISDIQNPNTNYSLQMKKKLMNILDAKYPKKNNNIISGLIDYNINLPFQYSKKNINDNLIKELNLVDFKKLYMDLTFRKIYTDNNGIYQIYTQLIDFEHFFVLPVIITIKINKGLMYLLNVEYTNVDKEEHFKIKAYNFIEN